MSSHQIEHAHRRDGDPDRGAATVAMITLCFVFMAGMLVWLSAVVDQSLHDRTNANALAFQAARAAAQSLDPDATRAGLASIDADAARVAASNVVTTGLAGNGDSGSMIAFRIDGNRVTVTVTITTTGRSATGTASATATLGFDEKDQ